VVLLVTACGAGPDDADGGATGGGSAAGGSAGGSSAAGGSAAGGSAAGGSAGGGSTAGGSTAGGSAGGSAGGAAGGAGGSVGGNGPLPQGNTGIAAQYPGDTNIQSNAAVLFADDFESYASAGQLTTRWDSFYQGNSTRIATEAANVYRGQRALEFTLPQVNPEVSNAVVKNISPAQDVLFVHVYTRFDPGYQVQSGSNHNGIRISSNYMGPGRVPNGRDFFLAMVENTISANESTPGHTRLYVYHPEQRSMWGDIWFPNGRVLPIDSMPHNFGPSFVQRPNFTPQRDRWYSYELMLKPNTPGQRDGRAAIWIDGVLIADFVNLRFRDLATMRLDQIQLELHVQVGGSLNRPNKKYYDNLVVARSYIGPMTP
jgi:hypothetical protein